MQRIIFFAVMCTFVVTPPRVGECADPAQSLPAGYMPEWSATRFDEAAACGNGVLPQGRSYSDAVLAARRHNRAALEQIISCSYSRSCDAAAGELHSGVLQQLLLAWGDIDFSRSLAAVKAQHEGRSPEGAFMLKEPDMRRFFPLTAGIYYGH